MNTPAREITLKYKYVPPILVGLLIVERIYFLPLISASFFNALPFQQTTYWNIFLIFSRKQFWSFFQIVSNRDNLHEILNPGLWEIYHQFVVCWISPESGRLRFKYWGSKFLRARVVVLYKMVKRSSYVSFTLRGLDTMWIFCHFFLQGIQYITKTYLYNFNPLKPHFYRVKLGFAGVYIIFLISTQKHRWWVPVRTASPRRF